MQLNLIHDGHPYDDAMKGEIGCQNIDKANKLIASIEIRDSSLKIFDDFLTLRRGNGGNTSPTKTTSA